MPATTYAVRLPSGHRMEMHDADAVEAYARSGARVTARTESSR